MQERQQPGSSGEIRGATWPPTTPVQTPGPVSSSASALEPQPWCLGACILTLPAHVELHSWNTRHPGQQVRPDSQTRHRWRLKKLGNASNMSRFPQAKWLRTHSNYSKSAALPWRAIGEVWPLIGTVAFPWPHSRRGHQRVVLKREPE